MDRYTETTHTGYLQNIGNSLKGALFGIIFLIGSVVLLWWNEGNSVAAADAIKEVQQKVVVLSTPTYDPAAEGKAVHVSGEVKPSAPVSDPAFNVTTDALRLKRHVQMYQWREDRRTESRDKLGGGTETVTTYSYRKEWSTIPQNSSGFKHPEGHANPPMPYRDRTFEIDGQMGDFHLSKEMMSEIEATRTLSLTHLPQTLGEAANHGTFLYIGENPAKPQVGDIKITYTYAEPGRYTFVAEERGKNLIPYTAENGRTLVFVRAGNVSPEKIFKEELKNNALFTWLWRGAGLLIMYLAFLMLMGPVSAFAKVIPVLGHVVEYGSALIAGILTLILGLIVIALAWMGARPMLSLALIAAVVGIVVAFKKFGRKKETQAAHHRAPKQSRQSPSAHPPHHGEPTSPPPRHQDETNITVKSGSAPDGSESTPATPPPRRQ